MKILKKYKELFEAEIFFNDDSVNCNDKYIELFDVETYDTEYKIDMEYYVSFGLKHILIFCEEYDINPKREIIQTIVDGVKEYVNENFLYRDEDNINVDDDLIWVVNDFKEHLKDKQPKEYEKYKTKVDLEKFNI